MVPRTILTKLSQLRWRERLLRLSWGAARWISIAAVVISLACLTDWLIDLEQETPWELRVTVLAAQGILWLLTAEFLVLRPLWRRLSDNWLALWVEDRVPVFGHRLISAVQLNQPGADTRGMSPELIVAVTHEAEERAATTDFLHLLDARRFKWSVALAGGFIVATAFALILWRETALILLARQFLADIEIPRAVSVESVKVEGSQLVPASRVYAPSGEEMVLHFRVRGMSPDERATGEIRIQPVGRPSERHPLTHKTSLDDGSHLYEARVPPVLADFTYRAKLRDGRTRKDSELIYVSRPVVEIAASVQLPVYCGVRPNYETQAAIDCVPMLVGHPRPFVSLLAGQTFERPQKDAEVIGPPGAHARVLVQSQKDKKMVQATLELLGGSPGEGKETVLRQVAMGLDEKGRHALGSFPLTPDVLGYHVIVQDQYGFTNADPPRREVRLVPDAVPQVVLLPEVFPKDAAGPVPEDAEVDGMPVPLGNDPRGTGRVRIRYACRDDYGLKHPTGRDYLAWLRFRVNEGEWRRHRLSETPQSDETGQLNVQRTVFSKEPARLFEFHAVPSADPEQLGRLVGGGFFDFHARGIPGLKIGDEIEFYIEVYDQHPDPDRPPGRSEVRVKKIVSEEEWAAWALQLLQHEQRIQDLSRKQRGVRIPAEVQ